MSPIRVTLIFRTAIAGSMGVFDKVLITHIAPARSSRFRVTQLFAPCHSLPQNRIRTMSAQRPPYGRWIALGPVAVLLFLTALLLLKSEWGHETSNYGGVPSLLSPTIIHLPN